MRALLDVQAVWSSPLTRALQTAIVGLAPIFLPHGCCATLRPLTLRANAREHQKLGAFDCLGVSTGEACVGRAMERLQAFICKPLPPSTSGGKRAAMRAGGEGRGQRGWDGWGVKVDRPISFETRQLAKGAAAVTPPPVVECGEVEGRWWGYSSETENMVVDRIRILLRQVSSSWCELLVSTQLHTPAQTSG